MRINSSVKEYVRESIRSKAEPVLKELNDKIAELEKEESSIMESTKKDYENELKKIKSACVESIKKLMKKYNVEPYYSNYEKRYYSPSIAVNWDDFKQVSFIAKQKKAIRAKIDKIEEKITKTNTEILAKLTLGGDMEMLNEMLSNLKF